MTTSSIDPVMKIEGRTAGRFGDFGGAYVPEILVPALRELAKAYESAQKDEAFQLEFKDLLQNYVGRPSLFYHAERLSKHLGGAEIYLKREDLNHTGAHKINNTLGQILLAKRMGTIKDYCGDGCRSTWCGHGHGLCLVRLEMCHLYG